MTPQERKELEELLRTAEQPPKAAPLADGRCAARISDDAKELRTKIRDKDLSKETAAPKPPKEPLAGRWLTGFEERNEKERKLAPRGGGKAEAEHAYRPGDVSKVEVFRSQGHTTIAGAHVSADGLVARSGRRRILPEDTDISGLEDKAEQLALVAGQVLHGRNATCFEGRVIDPLFGRPKRSIEELATQFGVSPAKIHRIIEHAKRRVLEALERFYQPKIVGDRCPTCGRVYDAWQFGQCARTNGTIQDRYIGPTWMIDWSRMRWPPAHLHPECLPRAYWGDAALMQKKYLRR